MNVLKRLLLLSTIILTAIQLAACGVATPIPISTVTIIPSLTLVVPTATVSPPAPSSTLTPTSSLSLSSAPDGLRMVYHHHGGLYLKDGNNPPRQLTQHEEDYEPRISDDGEKIVFDRRVIPSTLSSINADGSEEQALVTTSQLIALNMGYGESTGTDNTTFVPGTHLLLFTTYQSQTGGNGDLLTVDTDTGEIRRLLSPGKAIDYYVSPDGTKIAINSIEELGHIDIVSIDGKMISRNVLTYTPSEPIYLPPDIHWTQDSNSLVVVLPIPTVYDTSGGAPNYTVWRYAPDGSTGIQVPLDPMPKDLVKISPDGNWVTYHDERGALYIGDLRDGSSQLYEPQPAGLILSAWSPDNVHFVYGRGRVYLGSANTSSIFIDKGNFIGWLNANSFLYYANKTIVMGEIGGEKIVILTNVVESFQDDTIFTFILLD